MDGRAFLLVSELRDLLMARATGRASDESPYPADSARAEGESYSVAYRRLRAEVLALNHVKVLLPFFVEQHRTLDGFWMFIQPKFSHYQDRRRYLHEQFDPVLERLEAVGPAVTDQAMKSALAPKVDWEYVAETWQKSLDRRIEDPEAALTSARTLLETVCKHILDEAMVQYSSDGKIEPLVRAASERILEGLSPEVKPAFGRVIPESVEIVLALGSLRNKAGDSHGKGKAAHQVESWQAEFAVNLAGSLSAFLVQGWTSASAKPIEHPKLPQTPGSHDD